MIHPAKTMPFDDLLAGLEAARMNRFVSRRDDPSTGRSLYCYTNHCVYDHGWNTYSMLARGLIISESERRVIATPFPKFFNVGEHNNSIPDLSFETFEKVDGSLAIIHYHDSQWRVATKNNFNSTQAKWATTYLQNCDLSALIPGYTYLAEAVYADNRIVVKYETEELVLLAVYRDDGHELDFAEVTQVAEAVGLRAVMRHRYLHFSDLLTDASKLPKTSEGFVIRFSDGLRLKLKGNEYCRIHALISRCTPLGVWEAMAAGDDIIGIRQDLPEEFWNDFDQIRGILGDKMADIESRIASLHHKTSTLSDKELGLSLKSYPEDIRGFLFPYRKHDNQLDNKTKQSLWRTIRPTGDQLDGYVPSYAMGKMMDESI